MEYETVLVDNREELFIKVCKNDTWLLHACRGSGYRKGDLKRSSILTLLADKAALAPDGDETEQNSDPMNDVQCDPTSSGEPPKKKKKSSPIKRAADQIVSVEVDLVPKAADPTNVATHKVRVMVKQVGKIKVLRVHADHVPWLVTYIADEVAFGGVVQKPSDNVASTVVEANCDVPGLHVEWDFQQNVWLGLFLSGPMKGQTFSCGPAKFTADKWDKLVFEQKVQGSFAEATTEIVEQACLKFLELHCEKVLAANNTFGENSQ